MTTHATIHGPDWQLVTPAAEWQARDSCGYTVYDNHLWMIGGWFTPQLPNPLDVWKSPDGKHWTRVLEEGPWVQTDLPMTYNYDGKMWMMGGRKLPGSDTSNKVWWTTDGVDWTLATDNAAWTPRLGSGAVVFKDKMWLLGGVENFYKCDETTIHNDVWTSTDGANWTCVQPNAPWSKRAYLKAMVMDDKIWVMGGGCFQPETWAANDVWCSEDGVNWSCVTEAAPWIPRIWFGAGVYRDRLWVYGGMKVGSDNLNDVWFSENGADWTQMTSDVIWSERHEPTVFVFDDRLWCVAGHANPLSGEVWSLHLPEDYFA